jgi:phage terminase small subunit
MEGDPLALTEQQQAFVDHYVECANATEAARLAGYSHPNKQGPRLLKHPEIAVELKRMIADASATIGIDNQWLLSKLVDMYNVAMATVKPKLNSKTGKPIKDTDGNPIFTVNHGAALKALELIGKYLGVFKDAVEVRDSTGDYHQRLEDVKLAVLSNYRKPDAA